MYSAIDHHWHQIAIPLLALTLISPHAESRIKRSAIAKAEFKRLHPCPSTNQPKGPCPGYIIDHIQALKHGGLDRPENMQWQTIEESKLKDKWE